MIYLLSHFKGINKQHFLWCLFTCFTCVPLQAQIETNFAVKTYHNHYTRNIVESDDGHIWTIGDRQIFRLSDGLAYEIPFLEKMDLVAKETNIRGNLYIRGSELFFPIDNKIFAYDYVNETSREVWRTPDGGAVGFFVNAQNGHAIWIVNFRSTSNEVFYSEDGLSFSESIYNLDSFLSEKQFTAEYGLRATQDRLYVHPHYHGLLVIDKTGHEVDLPMPEELKEDLTKFGVIWRLDNTGRLWKMSITGAMYYDESAEDFLEHPSTSTLRRHILSGKFLKILPSRISCILEDSKGRMWLPGTDNFLICIDHENDIIFDFQKEIQEGLNSHGSDMRRLLLDRNENVWAIMNNGTMVFSPKIDLFERFQYNNIDTTNSVYDDYRKYASDSLIRMFSNKGRNSTINSVKLYDDALYYCHARAMHKLNIASRRERTLPYIDTYLRDFMIFENELYASFNSNVAINLKNYNVEKEADIFYVMMSAYQYDKDRFVCLAQNEDESKSMFLVNAGKWTIDREIKLKMNGEDQVLPHFNRVLVLDDGTILMYDPGYMCQVDIEGNVLKRQDRFFDENGKQVEMAFDRIRVVVMDSIGQIIIATDFDILELNPDTWQVKRHFQLQGKLDGKHIHHMIPVLDGYWLVTSGLLTHYSKSDDRLTYFDERDGYNYAEVLDHQFLPDGSLALGTDNGLAIFDPQKALRYKNNLKNEIPLHLLSYQYYSEAEDILKSASLAEGVAYEIDLAHNDRQLELEVQLMDAASEDHLYAYKIVGYTDQWSEAVNDNTINLFGLPPGKYDLKVRAAKSKGLWVQEPLTIKINIKEAWYKRWWAFVSYALLSFGFGYAVYRYRLYQITKYEKLRTRISSDLHDDVGTLLSSVAMQSDVLSLKATKENKEWIDNLGQLSREAMGRMRDTVWAIDSRKDNMESLVDRMQDFLSDFSENEKFNVHFEQNISNTKTKLPPDIRQNVYLIFKEAIVNAYKYSNGNELDIHINKSRNGDLKMTIKDNGQVDESDIKKSGIGLSNIKMRSERINGKLSIRRDDGFEVELVV